MGYYKYGGTHIESSVAKSKTHTVKNLLDSSKMVLGWVNTTVGGTDILKTSNTGTRTTEKIPVAPDKVVTMGYISGYDHNPFMIASTSKDWCLAYAFFDSSEKVVSGGDNRPSVNGGIVVPSGATYVRVTFFVDGSISPVNNPEKFFVYVEDEHVTNPTYYFKNGIEMLDTDDSMTLEHWGETWTLFGDSLTDSYGGHGWDESNSPVGGVGWKDTEDRVPWKGRFWASTIARKHGFVIDNQAHSGSNMYNSRVYNDVSGVLVLDAWLQKLQNGEVEMPSLITIGFGANSVQDEIGNEADAPSNTTKSLYAGAKYFIEKLNQYCPNARKVYILHPLQEEWRDTNGTAREAMRKVFEMYNVEYIDMSKNSGLTVDMLPDKLHVSSIEANRQYGRYLESYLF